MKALPSPARFLATALVTLAACSGESGPAPGDPAPAAGRAQAAEKKAPAAAPASEAPPAPKPRSVRLDHATWRPLLDEAERAELSVGGPVVDLGTADQLKYTLAGWRNGWGQPVAADEGPSYAPVRSGAVDLRTRLIEPVREVVLRLRSGRAGQRVGVLIGGKEVGNGDVGTDWTVVRVPIPEGKLGPGWQEPRFLFRHGGVDGTRAEIDWIWLRTGASEDLPVLGPRVLPIKVGDRARRALVAPSPRAYSFYLHVPADGALIFDYGAEVPTTFVVRVESEPEGTKEVFRAAAETGAWKEAKVDLSPWAGRAVRLELATEGQPGVAGWGEPELMIPAEKAPEKRAPGKPARNAIVILIDTQRYDSFKAFNPKTTVKTPAFDALAEQGTVFVNAYVNENWTKPSVATVLSGLYPTTHDTKTHEAKLPDDVELISERLKTHGFRTASLIANGYCSDAFGFDQGWDFYRNYIRENRISDAEYVYRDALEWLEKNKDERFFLYIQTIDPHVPYRVDRAYTKLYHPEEYRGPVGGQLDGHQQADISKGKIKIAEADYEWIRALYNGEVTYHDEHMGKFLAKVEEMGLADDTLIVVTNDHGEELNDKGRLGHGHSLYEHMIRSPLVMRYAPFFEAGARIEEVVEGVDLFPTLLEVLGLPPSKDVEGLSLVPLVRGEMPRRPTYAITEFLDGKRAVRVGRWKLMLSSGSWRHLYDVSVDPEENVDHIDDRPLARRLAEIYLAEGLAETNKRQRGRIGGPRRRFKGGEAKIDPELKKQLEALGYFGE